MPMTEKQQNALNAIISALPEESRGIFREIAEYAVSLGYKPKLNAKGTYADFVKSKHGKTIMKIDSDPKFPPRLAIRFDAMEGYAGIFYEAVEKRVDLLEGMGYTLRCWGCGKCGGSVGYNYALADGREGFFCGRGVIDIPSFCAETIEDVKNALRMQDECL